MSDNDVKIKLSLDGAEETQKGLNGVGDSAEKSDSKLGKLASVGLKGVAVAGAAVAAATIAAGAGLWNLAKGAAEAGDAIDENSHKLGLSYEAYQSWDYVLSQTGASIESLKGGMTRLNTAVDEAASGNQNAIDKFARLGISLEDLAGKSREDIFALTVEGLQGVTDAGERAAIATELLGRGAAEMGGLLATSAEETAALKQQAIDLGLILSDEAVAAGDAFNDSLDTLQRTMSGVKNTIGAELLPGLTEITLGLSGLLAGTEGSEERIQAGAETLVTALDSVLPKILGVFSQLIGTIITIAPNIIGSLVQGITDNLPMLVATLADGLIGLVGVLATQGPMLIAAGVTAIINLVQGVASALPELIPTIVEGVIGMVQALITAVPLLISAGLELISGLIEGVVAAIPVLIDALPALVESIVSYLTDSLPVLLDMGVELFMSLIEALPTVIDLLLGALPSLIESLIGALLGAIPLLINAGIQLFLALIGALPQIITSIVSALPGIITAIIDAVLSALPLLMQAGIDLFLALIEALPTIIVTLVTAIPQIITALIEGIIGAIPQIIMAGIQLLVALVENMPAIIGGIIGAIPAILTALIDAFAKMGPKMANAGLDLIKGLWKGISDAAGWLMGKISGFVDDVMGGIQDFFGIKSPSRRMALEVGVQLPAGLGVGVDKNVDAALGPIEDMNKQIMDEALKLQTSVAFDDSLMRHTMIPLRGTPAQQAPMSVEATLDPSLFAEAFSSLTQEQQQAPVTLSKESISTLASAIVSAVRVQSRQGASALG